MDNEASAISPRSLKLFFVAGGLLLVGLAALLLVVDPFGWHLWTRQTAAYTTLDAIPADSRAFLNVDLATLDRTRFKEIYDVFLAATADTQSPINTTNQTVTQLLQELDMTLQADVQPWLGQHVGLATLTRTASRWVLVAEAADVAPADAFLQKLAAGWQQRTGVTAVTQPYRRIPLTSFPGATGNDKLAFARADNLVLIGSDAEAVQQALDAQNGDSLTDNAIYYEAMAALPPAQPITLFIDYLMAEELVKDSGRDMAEILFINPYLLANSVGIISMALSLNTTPDGLLIHDSITYDFDELSEADRAAFDAWLETPQTAAHVPEDTLLYLAGSGLDKVWPVYRHSLAESGGDASDFDESMQLFAAQFGLDPGTDLFPYLDGEAAVAIVPSRSGPLAQVLRLNLGVALVANTHDEVALVTNLANFSEAIADPQLALAAVKDASADELTLYEITTSLQPGFPLVYGTGQEHFLLGTSRETLTAFNFDGGVSLADNAAFQAAQAALPDARMPTFYADVATLLQTLQSSPFLLARGRALTEQTAVFQPIRTIAATNTVSENKVQNSIVLFIDTD